MKPRFLFISVLIVCLSLLFFTGCSSNLFGQAVGNTCIKNCLATEGSYTVVTVNGSSVIKLEGNGSNCVLSEGTYQATKTDKGYSLKVGGRGVPCVEKSTTNVKPADTTSSCVANCNGKKCGDDGCGGSCGSCSNEKSCQEGNCKYSCNDPDQLNPYLVKTTVTTTNPIYNNKTDFCVSGSTVGEIKCSEDGQEYVTDSVVCSFNGVDGTCVDGACVMSSTPTTYTATTQPTPVCGNGVVQTGEECEIAQSPDQYNDGCFNCKKYVCNNILENGTQKGVNLLNSSGVVVQTYLNRCASNNSQLKIISCIANASIIFGINQVYTCPTGTTCADGACKVKEYCNTLYSLPLSSVGSTPQSSICAKRIIEKGYSSSLSGDSPFSYAKCHGVYKGVIVVVDINGRINYAGLSSGVFRPLGFDQKCPLEKSGWYNGFPTDINAAKRCIDEGKSYFDFYDIAC